jgi:glucose/arabinose dehydrogenase/PKD repeat protein
MLDDLRIYNRVLTPAQVQSDMTTPVGGPAVGSPQVLIDFPASGAQVGGIVNVTADASDDTGVASVQFYIDGVATGSPDTTDPYALAWDTRTVSNGAHTLTALATDVDGHTTLSAPVTVNVANGSNFQNEILATGLNLPTAIKFLPDGRMLVAELPGTVRVLPPPYTTPDPTPFLQLTNIGSGGDQFGQQQGIYDIALDPNFATNHYFYIFYTLGTPNVDRFSRFTANATLTGTVPGSEFVIYQDPEIANAEHHGGAINFSNDGKILITTGEHFNAGEAQDLTKPRGKILRFNMDGTIPTDNPFYDGAGPNYDAIWALGLRNPFRAYYDAPTGRLIIGDVGGNDYSTAIEEIDIGARGANYGWPNVETPNGNPAYTAPAYYYPHNGRDAAVVAGFVYHGTQFPSSYQGNFFFADYTQNWIKRLTFDSNGNVAGVFNFEPLDGSVDGPYGDIVYMTEGPDGALYYVDLGFSDISGTFGVSKIRRISFVDSDLPPVVSASATPMEGPTPLTVTFSSAGSSDPEGHPLTYSWDFGDGTTSTAPNPSHTYAIAGPYQARLTVSDGVNSTLSTPLGISAGNRPVATILAPTDGITFKAGDVITFSGSATDADDGTLPTSAYTWNIDFLHEGHVHPGIPITGVMSGTFTIPITGHDFSGFTRYRITLTVTDSSGLQSSSSVIIFPQKVNLTFDATPPGLTLYLDGIAHTAPFVYYTLIGFNHTIEARNQTVGTNTYNFVSWSDGGTQQHTIVVPSSAQSYVATFSLVADTTPPSPPLNLQATTVTASTATLSWTASTDNVGVTGYNVYRNGSLIGSTTQTSYTDTGLSPTTSYAYTVAAFDAANNLSQPSSALNVTTPAAVIAFVQQNYATPQTPQAQVSISYNGAQTAGNTNILIIGWNDVTASITSVTDSAGNVYRVAIPTFRGNGMSQAIYYASNIKSALAGSNTVTVTFNQPAVYVDARITEYSGLGAFDVGTSATGSGTTANSGSIVTTTSNELLIGAGITANVFTGAGNNFTQRVITSPDGDIVEDRKVSATGSYSATASLRSGAWLMQIASFKGL